MAQNVLVKGNQVFLTDFDIGRDWSELGHSTTEGPATKTLLYCAPEVAAERPRKSSSDIWSMGCVFVEIWSILCGETLAALSNHLETSGSFSTHYYQNTGALADWCNSILARSGDEGLDRPHVWVTSMLKEVPHERWTIQHLSDRIQETNVDPHVSFKFSSHCCADEDDISMAHSSDYQPESTDTQKPQIPNLPDRCDIDEDSISDWDSDGPRAIVVRDCRHCGDANSAVLLQHDSNDFLVW
jgi:serine/threonine protein kinase